MDERLARRLLTAERNRVTAKLRELEERLAMEEREAAGELADYDQHWRTRRRQYERERDEGRLEELRESSPPSSGPTGGWRRGPTGSAW